MYFILRSTIRCLILTWVLLLVDYSYELNKRITLISLERPEIVSVNPKFAHHFNITSRRPGRHDPVHYIHIFIQFFRKIDNNVNIHLFFQEFLSNDYKPSFVQMHFKFCDFFQFMQASMLYAKDENSPFTPVALFKPIHDVNKCCLEPGIYHIANMTCPRAHAPENFPFEKGRILVNATYRDREEVLFGRCDLELAVGRGKRKLSYFFITVLIVGVVVQLYTD